MQPVTFIHNSKFQFTGIPYLQHQKRAINTNLQKQISKLTIQRFKKLSFDTYTYSFFRYLIFILIPIKKAYLPLTAINIPVPILTIRSRIIPAAIHQLFFILVLSSVQERNYIIKIVSIEIINFLIIIKKNINYKQYNKSVLLETLLASSPFGRSSTLQKKKKLIPLS